MNLDIAYGVQAKPLRRKISTLIPSGIKKTPLSNGFKRQMQIL